MSDTIEISGFVQKKFEAVRDAFAANFADGGELGARFSAFCAGELALDIWAGYADRDKVVPWTDETLACVYSAGKSAISLLIARAVSEGKLDYERPVADYWPEFAAQGKDLITVVMAMSHQAGLCGFADPIPPEEWINHDKIAARLAAMAPLWPPGAAPGYHTQTIGYIANELIRRTAGRSIGEILRKDYFEGQGIDIHCGVAPVDFARIAYMPKPPSAPVHRQDSEFTKIAFLKPWSAAGKVSREDWLAAEIPASNMHATARALAEITHPFANRGVDARGVGVIDPSVVAAAILPRISGEDLVLPFHLTWAAGLMVNTNRHFGPSPTALGQPGFGGSAVMIDPAKKISAAYVMNKMSPALAGDPRAVRLFSALDACVKN
ncbi:MAG: serine hydrolase domain-containing protein [Pseudomonadota bacterium]